MNPVSNTAYYCCGVRMDDARRSPSICNDNLAERFMDARGLEIYAPFRTEVMPNISNIARCRIIDDYVAGELRRSPEASVVTIGAGFDTRPWRLEGGRWFELDEPQLIERKNERLPAGGCANPLTRIAIEFASESLADKLAAVDAGPPVVVVIEGVMMYLDETAIEQTLAQVQQRFPSHTLFCDLMTRRFFERYAQRMHRKLVAAGGRFSERPERPAETLLRAGYHEVESMPTLERARQLGLWSRETRIPGVVAALTLNLFARDLRGYAVHRFEYGTGGEPTRTLADER